MFLYLKLKSHENKYVQILFFIWKWLNYPSNDKWATIWEPEVVTKALEDVFTMDLGFYIISRWWFQIFFIFTPSWGKLPFLLIFFRWVETTNQIFIPKTTNGRINGCFERWRSFEPKGVGVNRLGFHVNLVVVSNIFFVFSPTWRNDTCWLMLPK